MTLPPENKRIAHHARFYVNLEKRITKADITYLLNNTPTR
jgi:hypothetical protein